MTPFYASSFMDKPATKALLVSNLPPCPIDYITVCSCVEILNRFVIALSTDALCNADEERAHFRDDALNNFNAAFAYAQIQRSPV